MQRCACDIWLLSIVQDAFALEAGETARSGPRDDDVSWCDPFDTSSIATAMTASLDPSRRGHFVERGFEIAAAHDWTRTAQAHLASYDSLREPAHA